MEPTTVIIVLLLLFGGAEHLSKEKAQAEVLRLETSLQETNEELKTALGVNESNASTIVQINNANSQCVADLEETRRLQSYFAEINADSKATIEELESAVDSYDWSSERIPSGLLDKITTN